jgi:hypothetical protein
VTTCPTLGGPIPQPCPRQPCWACREALAERAAILFFGQGTGGSPEEPTCSSRADADTLAALQLLATMPGQRALL